MNSYTLHGFLLHTLGHKNIVYDYSSFRLFLDILEQETMMLSLSEILDAEELQYDEYIYENVLQRYKNTKLQQNIDFSQISFFTNEFENIHINNLDLGFESIEEEYENKEYDEYEYNELEFQYNSYEDEYINLDTSMIDESWLDDMICNDVDSEEDEVDENNEQTYWFGSCDDVDSESDLEVEYYVKPSHLQQLISCL